MALGTEQSPSLLAFQILFWTGMLLGMESQMTPRQELRLRSCLSVAQLCCLPHNAAFEPFATAFCCICALLLPVVPFVPLLLPFVPSLPLAAAFCSTPCLLLLLHLVPLCGCLVFSYLCLHGVCRLLGPIVNTLHEVHIFALSQPSLQS